jgi:hypothetical protein
MEIYNSLTDTWMEESDPEESEWFLHDGPVVSPAFSWSPGQAEASQLCGRQEEACQNQI